MYVRIYDPEMGLYPPRWPWLMLAAWLESFQFGTNLLEKASSLWQGFGHRVELESANRMRDSSFEL